MRRWLISELTDKTLPLSTRIALVLALVFIATVVVVDGLALLGVFR